MKQQKTDLRIIKTKRSLYEALLLLLEQEPFEEIKVATLCEKALINRSTFYAHFEDKYALLDSLIKDLKENLAKELEKNHNITNSKEYYMELIKLLLEHVNERRHIYRLVVLHNKNSVAMDMIYDALNEDIKRRIVGQESIPNQNIPCDFISRFYLGAIFNIGMEWLKDPSLYTQEEIITYLDLLIPKQI